MKDFEMSSRPEWRSLSDIPMGSSCPSFHITDINAGWRVFKPVVHIEKCIGCYRCYYVCPDGAIHMTSGKKAQMDFDFCKGCGICAHECKPKAIEMIKEEK